MFYIPPELTNPTKARNKIGKQEKEVVLHPTSHPPPRTPCGGDGPRALASPASSLFGYMKLLKTRKGGGKGRSPRQPEMSPGQEAVRTVFKDRNDPTTRARQPAKKKQGGRIDLAGHKQIGNQVSNDKKGPSSTGIALAQTHALHASL